MTVHPESGADKNIDDTGSDPDDTIDQTLPMGDKDIVEGEECQRDYVDDITHNGNTVGNFRIVFSFPDLI